MSRLSPIICFCTIYFFSFSNSSAFRMAEDRALNIMSFNIRLNVASDGYNAWPNRTAMVESMIRFYEADLMGVQEALPEQMEDLKSMLPDFGVHGVARDTGRWGEYSAIFYKKSRLEFIQGSTFWLSPTPEVMSKGWDAALNRIASWAIFKDRITHKQFFYLNTHFDHRGEQARIESAKLIPQQIKKLNPQGLPVIVSGDFNITPNTKAYQTLTQSLEDTYHNSVASHHGPASTWSGFQFPGVPERRIDYIFSMGNVQSLRHATLSDSWSGRFPSDHLPVLVSVLIDPVKPLPSAHAHNDYEHENPLFDALNHGFMSVEADVWLINGELYVSHNRPGNLSKTPVLKDLYLEPLAQRISQQQGWVYAGYPHSFSLMIDLKNEGENTYRRLKEELSDFEYLLKARRNQAPPIMIFLSGDRPISTVQNDPSRLLGIDGRPDDLGKGFDAAFMPVVSQRYGKILTWNGKGEIPEKELKKLQDLVEKTHAEGKKLRLWASPETEACWEVLLKAGVDMINTDELARLQQFLEANE